MKPFKALKVRISRYIKRRETVAAPAATISVAPVFEKVEEEEKGQDSRQPQTHFTRDTRRQENVTFLVPQPIRKNKNNQDPEFGLKVHRVKDPNCELREGKHCAICTSNGCIYPSNWLGRE